MFTNINLYRQKLITKEHMKKYCEGEDQVEKDSVNDDLESFFEKIRVGKEPDDWVQTYFLPKLSETELELVERRDANYFQTFIEESIGNNPDVEEAEMKLSESNSKYVKGSAVRKTYLIQNKSNNFRNCALQ